MGTHTQNHSLSARCIAEYDLLLRDARHREETRASLLRQTNAHFLYFNDGRPLCTSLRPYFIDEVTYQRASQAAAKVARGIGLVALKLAERESLRALARLPRNIAAAVERDLKILESALVSRLDGFLDSNGEIHFVECNIDPHGVSSSHVLCDVFDNMPIMDRLRRRFAFRTVPVLKESQRAYVTMHERLGGRGAPRVMSFFDTSTTTEETRRRFMMLPEGVTLVTASSRFVPEKGRIYVDGQRVDVLENLDIPTLQRCVPDHPLVKAVRNRRLIVPGGVLGSLLRGSRATFAMLSDDENASWFPADVRRAIRKHVPWTRIVGDTKTTYRGETIELLPMIRRNKDNLVLKFDGSYGGKKVTLGWRVTQRAWSAAIRTALKMGHWVVQERVHIPTQTFPVVSDGRVVKKELYCDMNPFVWNGERAAGALVRVSGRDLLNITSGGSQLPMFVVSAAEN